MYLVCERPHSRSSTVCTNTYTNTYINIIIIYVYYYCGIYTNGYILIPICILLLYIITVYIPVWIYTYEYISLSMDQPPAFALLWYILLLHIKHKLRIDRYFYTCMYIYVLYTYSPRSLLMPIGLF